MPSTYRDVLVIIKLVAKRLEFCGGFWCTPVIFLINRLKIKHYINLLASSHLLVYQSDKNCDALERDLPVYAVEVVAVLLVHLYMMTKPHYIPVEVVAVLLVQGRIQDFLIGGGEPNNLGYRGRGTNERSEWRAKRVTSEASINQLGVQFFFEFRTPESESDKLFHNFFVTFLLRIFWKIFFMIIDLISFRYLKIIMKQSTILL